ncbi:hypothetical protein FBU30_010591 [Linnemannia zychae]|nr:hypothetical protein FBU30_010591 [Linnemannia zychae]
MSTPPVEYSDNQLSDDDSELRVPEERIIAQQLQRQKELEIQSMQFVQPYQQLNNTSISITQVRPHLPVGTYVYGDQAIPLYYHQFNQFSQPSPSQQPARPVSPPPSPAISSVSTASLMRSQKRKQPDSDAPTPPTLNPKAPKTARITNKERSKHVFTDEQDRFLALLLSEDGINEVLQGAGERNQAAPPKSKIHQDIASEFNAKFNSNLDGTQVKNKIAHMQRIWKEMTKFRDTTGNGDDDDETLREKVLKRCSFYYIVEPVWSVSWSLAPRKIISTVNLDDDADRFSESQHVDNNSDDLLAEDIETATTIDIPENTMPIRKNSRNQQQSPPSQQTKREQTKSQLDMLITSLNDAKKTTEFAVTEQETTKRYISANEESTKREELRVQLEIQKEITKQNELKLQIEQAICERLRLEAQARERSENVRQTLVE